MCTRFFATLAALMPHQAPRKRQTIEDVAEILGNSATTIRRYYAKWTPEYQSRQDALIPNDSRHRFGTGGRTCHEVLNL